MEPGRPGGRKRTPAVKGGRLPPSLMRPFTVLDFLVIVSLLLNFYGLYLSAKMGSELNNIDMRLTVINQTLEKNTEDLNAHLDVSKDADPPQPACNNTISTKP